MHPIYFGEPPKEPAALAQETETTIRGGDLGPPLASLSPMAEDALNGPGSVLTPEEQYAAFYWAKYPGQ